MASGRQRDPRVMVLPQPLSTGEKLKICAFDGAVMIEGCGEPCELQHGESASFITVVVNDDCGRWCKWERVPALPGA